MPYYGLYTPVKSSEVSSQNNGTNLANSITVVDSVNDSNKDNIETTDVSAFVFEDKREALKVLKQHKDARFKEFVNEEDAIKYAQTGFEIVQSKYNDVKTSTELLEKPAFRAPTKQQLASFRQIIEIDDWKQVQKIIWENPRYLVSSGDTPTILKEGFRYNAMHVCALSMCPNVSKLILDTVSDPKFADLLMGKKNDEKSCKELCANLLDYYLNLPEKGRNETPLHFASKFGHPEIVRILISYPECKSLRNAEGRFARQMICERRNKHVHHEIWKLLEERFYVPVLRCNDNAIPGQIGEPFSADNPPNLNCDPLTPELEIKALAGPMSEEQAKKFFRRWKTPPRLSSNLLSPIANNSFITPVKPHDSTPVRIHSDSNSNTTATYKRRSLFNSTPQKHDYNGIINSNGTDKSLHDEPFDRKQNGIHDREVNENECTNKDERENNNLGNLSKSQINTFKMSLYPRTPLFKLKNAAFSIFREQNIASPLVDSIGIVQEVNDSLLNVSNIFDSPGFNERHVKNTDIEKGLECIGRVLAKEKNIEWREYWDFLEEFVDITSTYGLMKLENYFAQRQNKEEEQNKKPESAQNPDLLDDVCNALENAFRITATSASATSANTLSTHQSTTPYTYVEKSLQVHAKRMTKTIIHNIDNEISIIDALLSELRRVKSLIYSFKEDTIYMNVNFAKVHSRIGNLVSMVLENSQEVSKKMKWKILVILQNISVEQDERREHIECVCSRIVEMLQHPTEQIQPENLKTEEMCSNIWSQEKDCDCQWESNLSRKTSRRNRMEARYKNHQRLKQQEKLQKDLDNQQKVNNKDEWRNTKDASNNSSDEDEFWSDFGGSESEEEIFLTPCESPSCLNELDNESNSIFIYGNEPTKRDLDVLNAIFHIDIDKNKYPNIHSWKSTIMRYSNEEMDFFPSPRIVKKSYSFIATGSNSKDFFVHPQTPTSSQKSYSIVRSNTSSSLLNSPRQQLGTAAAAARSSFNAGIIKEPTLQVPMAKRLFMSPERTKPKTATFLTNNTNSKDASNETTAASSVTEEVINVATIKFPVQHQLKTQRPLTNLNKLRGLFSAYRETVDNSPLSTSST